MIGDGSVRLRCEFWAGALAVDDLHALGVILAHELDLDCDVPRSLSTSVRKVQVLGADVEKVPELVIGHEGLAGWKL